MISNYFIVIFFTLFSNIFAFVKEIFTASYFGITSDMDVFIFAFGFINIFNLIFAAGALQGGFVPNFLKKYNDSEEAGWQYFYNIVGLMFLSGIILSIVAILCSNSIYVVKLIAPGFDSIKAIKFNEYILVLSIYLVFSNLTIVYTSLLQALNIFHIASIPPIINNVVIVLTIYLLHIKYQVYSLVIASVLGCLAGFAIQFGYVSIIINKTRTKFKLNFSDIKEFFVFIFPMIALILVDQIDALIQKTILSSTGEGNIAVLNYSYRLIGIPVGLLGGSVAVVAFPAISSLISNNSDSDLVCEKISNAAKFLMYTLVPVTVFILIFNLPLVKLIFERGQFIGSVSEKVASGLLWYTFGILPQSILLLYSRVFLAYNDSKTPLKIGIIAASLHIILCFYFTYLWGFIGIAIATSLYALIYLLFMYISLHRKYIKQHHLLLLRQVVLTTLASLICGLIVYYSSDYLQYLIGYTKFSVLFYASAYFVLYFFMTIILPIEESRVIIKFISSRFQKSEGK